MSDDECSASHSVHDTCEVDFEEEIPSERFGENSPAVSETIAGNLSRNKMKVTIFFRVCQPRFRYTSSAMF